MTAHPKNYLWLHNVQLTEPAKPFSFLCFIFVFPATLWISGWGSSTLHSAVNNVIKHRKWFSVFSLHPSNEGQGMLRKLAFPMWEFRAASQMGVSFRELGSHGLGHQGSENREYPGTVHGCRTQGREQDPSRWMSPHSAVANKRCWAREGNSGVLTMPPPPATGLSCLISFNPKKIPK